VPWFPIIGVILCIALMCSLPVITWRRFFVWLSLGLVIYFLYSVRHSRLRHGVDTGETENEFPPIVP
jgi:APA family basic amino acid/polyamine antiporter